MVNFMTIKFIVKETLNTGYLFQNFVIITYMLVVSTINFTLFLK